MSPERHLDTGKEKVTDEELLSDDGSVYQEGDDVYMEEFDEEDDFDEAGLDDDYDEDAMSFDDDEIDEDGLVEEHPFEEDVPPQAALLDFSAPQESPYSKLEALKLTDILPPGSKRRARPDFAPASTLPK